MFSFPNVEILSSRVGNMPIFTHPTLAKKKNQKKYICHLRIHVKHKNTASSTYKL